MRNVVKGFQASKMAVPKVHAVKIQQAFDAHHAPSNVKRVRIDKPTLPKKAPRMPGRNPGTRL
jgi:hypothetical protein